MTGWARACSGTYDGVCGGGTYTYTPPPVISTTTTFTWTQRTSGHTFDSIAISSDGTKLAATSYGNYIYTSVDSGATWTARTSAGSRNWYFISSSADGTKLAAVENNGHIFVSSNSGATWAQTSAVSGNWTYIASSADGTKLAAVNKDSYLYTSADSGATWTARTSAGQRSWFTIASSADGTKLIAGVFNDVPTVPGTGYLYTSTDSGTTWTQRTGAGKRMWYSVSSSSDGNKLVAVSNDGSIYTSADSGSTWISQTSSSGQGWFHVSSSSDGSVIVASPYSGYIYVSTDSGVTWTKQSSPGSVGWQSLVSSSDGTRFAAGVNGSYVWTSSSSITTISTPQPSTTTDSRLDGWDGWISLSGSNYGVTYASTTGYFSGFAWGSDVLGWISFNNSSSGDSTIYAVKGPSSAPVPDAPVVTTGSTVSSSCSGTNPSVSISFDLVTGASSYKLYRCDSSNSNCSPLFSQTTSPVTDVITNNVSATYYYHLTSVNSSGTESVPSSSIQANVTACVLNPVNTQSFKTNPSTINVVGGKCNFIVNLVNTPD
ncbi:MAG: hypothetical protein WCO18_02650, partial [bacterium]